MEILTILVTGILCVVCFFLGAKVGAGKQSGIFNPSELHPIRAYREREARKDAEMEQGRIDAILRNIERYDGTSKGQEDVPEGR